MNTILSKFFFFSCIFILILSCEYKNGNSCCKAGIDPIRNIVLMENHNHALLVFKKLHVKNRTLVHFDAHLDMNWISKDELSLINSPINPDSLETFLKHPYQYYIPRKKFVHVGNWIYPLLMDGSVSQFYWVVPDKEILTQHWIEMFKKGLMIYQKNIDKTDINSFRINKELKRVQGYLYGKPVFITTLENLPQFTSPILLDIDTDYFDFNSALFLERLMLPLFWPDEFVSILAEKKLSADVVTICYSLQDGYNTLALRFMGQDLKRILRNGSNLTDKNKRLLKLHRVLYSASIKKTPINIQSSVDILKTEFPTDAASYYLLSRIFAAEGNRKAALAYLKMAAHLDKEYKFAALHKANNFFYDKNYAEALRLYEKIFGQNLLANDFIFSRIAECSRLSGDFKRAAKIYRRLIQSEPDNQEFNSGLKRVLFQMKMETTKLNKKTNS